MELIIIVTIVGFVIVYNKWHSFQLHILKKKYCIKSFDDFIHEYIEREELKRYDNKIYHSDFEVNSFKIYVREFEYSDFNYATLHQMLLMYASSSNKCDGINLDNDNIGYKEGGFVYRLRRSPITFNYLTNDFSYLRSWRKIIGRDVAERKPISTSSNEHVYINAALYINVTSGVLIKKSKKIILRIYDLPDSYL